MSVILYSTGCSKCMILESMLKKKGIDFETCRDIKEMRKVGLMSAPALSINDKLMDFEEAVSEIQKLA